MIAYLFYDPLNNITTNELIFFFQPSWAALQNQFAKTRRDVIIVLTGKAKSSL